MLELEYEEVNGVPKWTEKDIQDVVTLLSNMYANGLGSKDVKSVVRDICINDIELAKLLYEETTYWIRAHNSEANARSNHEEDSRT